MDVSREEIKKMIIEIVEKHPNINRYELLAELNKRDIMISYSTLRTYIIELISEGKLRFSEKKGRAMGIELN